MHRIIRILLVIFIFWLCLACHVKAQGKIGLSLDKLPPGVERTLVGWPCIEYPALVAGGYADIKRLSPLLQIRQDILNDPEGFGCDIWDEPFQLVLLF